MIRTLRVRNFSLLSLAAFLAWSLPAFAQAPLEPSQLPAQTSFYMIWRGTPVGEARKANSLLALWDDPGFAPVRSAIVENLLGGADKDAAKLQLTRDQIDRYSTLLENAFVLGSFRDPHPKSKPAPPAKAAPAASPWDGAFFVYNRVGKEKLLTEAILGMRSQGKDLPKISQVTVAEVPALKIERKTGVTYWVENGKYAISAKELSVLEEILTRLHDKSPPSNSLAQSPAYQEALPYLSGGPLEFFFGIPNLNDLASGASVSGVSAGAALQALKLSSIHSVCGHVTLEGSKTRIQGALLGDAAPGTLFDLFAAGQSQPPSLTFLSPDTISYSDMQINLPGIYDTLKHAISSALPPAQQGGVAMVEVLAQAKLGMTIHDALNMFTGDLVSMQTDPAIDPTKIVYAFGIHQKPYMLKLLRTIFSDRLSGERNEGDITFLKVSLGGGQGTAGSAQWNFFHLAVTPDFVIGSAKNDVLRDFLAKHPQGGSDATVALPATLQAIRAKFPEKLDGLSYFNFQAVDWHAVRDRLREGLDKASAASPAAKNSSLAGTAQNPAAKRYGMDWLGLADPQVVSRHLHLASGATWKDLTGIHFEEWIE